MVSQEEKTSVAVIPDSPGALFASAANERKRKRRQYELRRERMDTDPAFRERERARNRAAQYRYRAHRCAMYTAAMLQIKESSEDTSSLGSSETEFVSRAEFNSVIAELTAKNDCLLEAIQTMQTHLHLISALKMGTVEDIVTLERQMTEINCFLSPFVNHVFLKTFPAEQVRLRSPEMKIEK